MLQFGLLVAVTSPIIHQLPCAPVLREFSRDCIMAWAEVAEQSLVECSWLFTVSVCQLMLLFREPCLPPFGIFEWSSVASTTKKVWANYDDFVHRNYGDVPSVWTVLPVGPWGIHLHKLLPRGYWLYIWFAANRRSPPSSWSNSFGSTWRTEQCCSQSSQFQPAPRAG